MPVPAAVAVPVADGAGVAVVVGIILSASVTSSASTPPSSASALSSSLPPLSPHSGALTPRPSTVLFAPEVGLVVCVVRPAGSLLLLSPASLVASALFAHLLLSAMCFPLQLGRFSCVWPQREPCFALHPTTLHLSVLVRCGPDQ